MAHMKLKTIRERSHKTNFTQEGLDLKEQIKKVAPFPVILIGPPGSGKTQLMHQVIREMGTKDTAEYVGCHPGLDIIDVIGGYQAKADDNGRPTMVWVDGPLTRAMKNGTHILMDELPRLSQPQVGRIMGATDETRLVTLTEKEGERVEAKSGFQMLATGNPPASNYQNVNIDEAMKSRFMIFKYVSDSLCDEKTTLEDILGGDGTYAQAFLNWANDMREDPTTHVSTRDLCYLAKMVGRGFDAIDAISLNYRDKVTEDKRSIVMTSASAHFEN